MTCQRGEILLDTVFPTGCRCSKLKYMTSVHCTAMRIARARVTFDKIVPYHRSIRDFGVVKAGIFPPFHTATELANIPFHFIFFYKYHISHTISLSVGTHKCFSSVCRLFFLLCDYKKLELLLNCSSYSLNR